MLKRWNFLKTGFYEGINIVEGNCFTTNLRPQTVDGTQSAVFDKDPATPGTEPVTRVLMNPPFALRGAVDQERLFVSRALSLMADGGILFSLLPMDCMFGAHEDRVWRTTELLAHHTLLAVVSFPDELFYPAALKQVIGIIVRRGFPHPKEQPVFWARIAEDGQIKVKSKRIAAADLVPPRTARNDIPRVLPLLRSFIANPDAVVANEPMLCKTAPVDFDDPLLELLPEAYLDSVPPTPAQLEATVDAMARDTAAFLIRFGQERRAGEFS